VCWSQPGADASRHIADADLPVVKVQVSAALAPSTKQAAPGKHCGDDVEPRFLHQTGPQTALRSMK